MASLYQAFVEIVPEAKNLRRTLAKEFDAAGPEAGRSAGRGINSGVLGAVGGLAAPLAAAFAAIGIGSIIKNSINSASDFAESGTAITAVFGDADKTIQDFAANAAASLGQSTNMTLDAARVFGTFGKAAGLGGEDLADFSTEFITLAGDLASFNNTTPEQAIEALGAGLRGESEPLRQYGVLLDDAALKARATELGIYSGTGALTAQQKVLASQAEIMAQTGVAQGDFAKTSGGLANQQRILSAGLENLSTTFGALFLPVVLGVVGFLNTSVVPAFEKVVASISGVKSILVDGDFTSAFHDAFNIEEDSPIVDYLFDIREAFLSGGFLEAAMTAFQPVIDWLKTGGLTSMVSSLLSGREALLGAALELFPVILDAIVAIIPMAVASMAGLVVQLVGAITAAMPALMSGMATLLTAVLGALAELLPVLVGAITTALPMVITALLGMLPVLITALVGMLPMLLTAAIDLFTSLITALVTILPVLVSTVIGMLPVVVQALLEMLPTLLTAAVGLFTSLLTALVTIVPVLIEALLGMLPVVIQTLLGMLPTLLTTAVNLFMALITAVITILPQLITSLLAALPVILETLLGMLPMLLTTAIDLFFALITAIFTILPELLTTIVGMLPQLITTLMSLMPMLVTTAITLFGALMEGLVDNVPKLVSFIFTDLIPSLVGAILDSVPLLLDAGKALIQGFFDGIGEMAGGVGDAIGGVMDGIADFFPHSPAKRGPFSGSGWTAVKTAGLAIGDQFGAGLSASEPAFNAELASLVPTSSLTARVDTSVYGSSAGGGAGGGGSLRPIVQNINTIHGQSNAEIAHISANDLSDTIRGF